MRTMLSSCTASTPPARPARRCFHGAGYARIAASRTIIASRPLHPERIVTANPFACEYSVAPTTATAGSKARATHVATCATASVHGPTTHTCAGGVSCAANRARTIPAKTSAKRAIAARVHDSVAIGRRAFRQLRRDLPPRRGISGRRRKSWLSSHNLLREHVPFHGQRHPQVFPAFASLHRRRVLLNPASRGCPARARSLRV